MKELLCATGLTGSFAMDQAQHDAPLWRVRRGTGQKGGVSVRVPNRNPGGSPHPTQRSADPRGEGQLKSVDRFGLYEAIGHP